MGLGKQAKTLTRQQTDAIFAFLGNSRNGLRDQTIFLLSVRAGLRAKEIAHLQWFMLLDPDGKVADMIQLTDIASKGRSGRVIPINKQLRQHLKRLLEVERQKPRFDQSISRVITTQRRSATSAQAIVNKFHCWYQSLGLLGCSSHSGRRTFITNAARKISTVGGSLRDVQSLAGHSSLQTTQRYIEFNSEARRKIVDLI
jgi:integrase/recombinase XerD